MTTQNTFTVQVEALDAGQGYLIRGTIKLEGQEGTQINEHAATEALVRTRLGTGFDIWAAQVDSE